MSYFNNEEHHVFSKVEKRVADGGGGGGVGELRDKRMTCVIGNKPVIP